MTYAEFKRLDVYKTADIVELFDERGVEIDDCIPEEELDGMDVNAYHIKGSSVCANGLFVCRIRVILRRKHDSFRC